MTNEPQPLPQKYSMPKRVMQMLAFSIFLWIVGLALLAWVDWRIAAGVFICLWANNILRK